MRAFLRLALSYHTLHHLLFITPCPHKMLSPCFLDWSVCSLLSVRRPTVLWSRLKQVVCLQRECTTLTAGVDLSELDTMIVI